MKQCPICKHNIGRYLVNDNCYTSIIEFDGKKLHSYCYSMINEFKHNKEWLKMYSDIIDADIYSRRCCLSR